MESVNNPYQTPIGDLTRDDDEEYGEIRFFSPEIRIGRLRYLAHSALIFLAMYLAMTILIFGMASLMESPAAAAGLGLVALVLTIAAYVPWFIVLIQRLHDLNHSGWWSLLMLVPFVNIVFAFYVLLAPGTKGRNNYGPPPPPNQLWHWIVGLTLPAIFFLGIIAAIAIPAYYDYTQRAQQHQQSQP